MTAREIEKHFSLRLSGENERKKERKSKKRRNSFLAVGLSPSEHSFFTGFSLTRSPRTTKAVTRWKWCAGGRACSRNAKWKKGSRSGSVERTALI